MLTPDPVAAWLRVRMILDSSHTGIISSNPARGTDVYPHLSVLCSL